MQTEKKTKIQDLSKGNQQKIQFISTILHEPEFLVKDENGVKEFLKENKQKILDEKITSVIYLPKNSTSDKKIKFYSKNPNNKNLFNRLRDSFNQVLTNNYFSDKDLSEGDIKYARTKVFFDSFRISKGLLIKAESKGNRII